MALSGRDDGIRRCPLSGVKRTSVRGASMSAFDPKRTSAQAQQKIAQAIRNRLRIAMVEMT
jgi:hypothetical protein